MGTIHSGVESAQCWQDLDMALGAGMNRVLLYGMPGTGKTFYALHNHLYREGVQNRRAYRVLCAPDMTTADIDGMWRPSKEEWQFGLGSAFRAFVGGHRLILDELDQASGDVLTALLLYCDSAGSAVREHPETGDLVRGHEKFEIIATTNAERLTDLPAALLDRFPVRININCVNPDALAVLPEGLREIADAYSRREYGRFSIRSFIAYDHLSHSVSQDDALRLVFGDEARAIREALAVAGLGNRESMKDAPTSTVTL